MVASLEDSRALWPRGLFSPVLNTALDLNFSLYARVDRRYAEIGFMMREQKPLCGRD
jgi:hypothetical protein